MVKGLGFMLLAAVAEPPRCFLPNLPARVVPVSAFYRIASDVPFGTMNLWSHWDGEHSVALAAGGYLQPPENVLPGVLPSTRCSGAFVRGGVWGPRLRRCARGVGRAGLAPRPAVRPLLRLQDRRARPGRRATARRTVLVLAFFPPSLSGSAVYYREFVPGALGRVAVGAPGQEGPAARLPARRVHHRHPQRGLFLLVHCPSSGSGDRHAYRWRGAYLALAPGGLIAYGVYLWLRFGNPFLFYTDQAKWGREAAGPLAVVGDALPSALIGAGRLLRSGPPRGGPSLGNLANHIAGANNATNLLFLPYAVALLLAGSRWMPPSLAAYALVLIAARGLFWHPAEPADGDAALRAWLPSPSLSYSGACWHGRILGGWLALSAAYSLVLCALFSDLAVRGFRRGRGVRWHARRYQPSASGCQRGHRRR